LAADLGNFFDTPTPQNLWARLIHNNLHQVVILILDLLCDVAHNRDGCYSL
jgi:hypothetical protein